MRVHVHGSGEVEVVLPERAALRRAGEAVDELRPWIARRRAALARAAAELGREPGCVPYLGTNLRLVENSDRQRVHRVDDELLIPSSGAEVALERWYKRNARLEIRDRLDLFCARVGQGYSSLTIRDQRTRWGSCSTEGSMSFNWRLLLAPEAVLDYVVQHEICHLDVMDHSDKFWALLESRCPNWNEQARWLKRYGQLLNLPLLD